MIINKTIQVPPSPLGLISHLLHAKRYRLIYNVKYNKSLEHDCSKIYNACCAVEYQAVSMNIQHPKPGHLRCKHKYANV